MKHRDLRTPASVAGTLRILSLTAALAAATLCLAPASSAQAPVKDDDGAIRVGRSLFADYCTSCHGATAEGDGPLASSLRIEPANLTLLMKNNGGEFPFDRVEKKIDGTEKVKGHGSADMPIWGEAFRKIDESATDEAVRSRVVALAHFLRSVQTAD